MNSLTGRLNFTALSEYEHDKIALIDEINRVIKPARPATLESTYIGVLLAASNQVNAQGGCFARQELLQLAELVIDAPVMVGHRKDELPIGRVFKGEVIDRGGSPWLRAFFYWHRDQTRAAEIKTGIDAGIYKECSLGFLYAKPECGICRGDMRSCRHRVHEIVRHGGRDIRAFYYYKQLDRVLEISLVYRGAVAGTSVSTLNVAANQSSSQPCGVFELRTENHRTALLSIDIDGIATCFRLLNFERPRIRAGQMMRCEEVNAGQTPAGLYLLDRGKVKHAKGHPGELEFFGTILRGRYQLSRGKGGQ
ncbi:MAG: hypothetical protein WBP29_05290 [Candidatus Zixiibacteriota bacterium]